jgi:hypothetical protein
MASNWFADKLGTAQPQQQARPANMLVAPSQIPMARAPQAQSPQVDRNLGSMNETGRCPECRSGNYMKVGSQITASGSVDAWRCYDCGYPKIQQGSGGRGVSVPSQGPTQAAIQVPTGGWNPQTIFGHM